METIGAKLKKIRLEKGLTLEEVHKQTKIHLNILRAIEEESLVNFSPVYIKGFVKIYCNFLGINPSECIPEYSQAQAPLRSLPQEQQKKISLPIIGMPSKTTVLIVAVLAIVVIGLFNFGKSRAVAPKQAKRKEIAKLQKSKAPSAVLKSQPKEQAVSSVIRLGIRAKEDCWIQLKADGKVIFQNILRKGRFENWQAKEKIEFSLGNAGVVELEVNGKIIPALGRRGQAVKNILLTKAGLSTSR